MTGRKLIPLILLLIIAHNLKAQMKAELVLRSNLGIGFEYNTLKFSNENNSGDMMYSSGGGLGLEAGIAILPLKNLETYATISYHQNLALQYFSSSNGSTDKTSFTFSRGSLFMGANYILALPFKKEVNLKIGGGGNYSLPGKMAITELNRDYGTAAFDPAAGFHLELGVSIELNEKWTMLPSLRYRSLNFHLKEYKLSHNDLPGNIIHFFAPTEDGNINAAGIDMSFTMRRKL